MRDTPIPDDETRELSPREFGYVSARYGGYTEVAGQQPVGVNTETEPSPDPSSPSSRCGRTDREFSAGCAEMHTLDIMVSP